MSIFSLDIILSLSPSRSSQYIWFISNWNCQMLLLLLTAVAGQLIECCVLWQHLIKVSLRFVPWNTVRQAAWHYCVGQLTSYSCQQQHLTVSVRFIIWSLSLSYFSIHFVYPFFKPKCPFFAPKNAINCIPILYQRKDFISSLLRFFSLRSDLMND